MAPYVPPSITAVGSLRSLTGTGLGIPVLEVGSVSFPDPDPGIPD